MKGRLKLIEQQLIGIDSAAFQNLCDIYLALREQEFASFNRFDACSHFKSYRTFCIELFNIHNPYSFANYYCWTKFYTI